MTMRWLTSRTLTTCAAPANMPRRAPPRRRVGRETMPVERDVAGRLGPDEAARRERPRGRARRPARAGVVDRDMLGPVARRRLGLGDDQRDRVADMPHDLAGERRRCGTTTISAPPGTGVIRQMSPAPSRARSAAVSTATHPRNRQRRRRVDAADIGEGVRRAHKDAHAPPRQAARRRETGPSRSAAGNPRSEVRSRHSCETHPSWLSAGTEFTRIAPAAPPLARYRQSRDFIKDFKPLLY